MVPNDFYISKSEGQVLIFILTSAIFEAIHQSFHLQSAFSLSFQDTIFWFPSYLSSDIFSVSVLVFPHHLTREIWNPWISTIFFLSYSQVIPISLVVYNLYSKMISNVLSQAQSISLNSSHISSCLCNMITWMPIFISQSVCSKNKLLATVGVHLYGPFCCVWTHEENY